MLHGSFREQLRRDSKWKTPSFIIPMGHCGRREFRKYEKITDEAQVCHVFRIFGTRVAVPKSTSTRKETMIRKASRTFRSYLGDVNEKRAGDFEKFTVQHWYRDANVWIETKNHSADWQQPYDFEHDAAVRECTLCIIIIMTVRNYKGYSSCI